MIEELKEKGMPVNGFLDKSEPVTFGEDGITVHVSAGRQILESVELPRVLAEMIQERTGSLPVVRLTDSGKARTEEEFEQYLQEKGPVVKFEAKETPPDLRLRVSPSRTSRSSCSTASSSSPPTPAASTIWATAARSRSGATSLLPRSRAAAARFILPPSPTTPAPSTSRSWGKKARICPSGRASSSARPHRPRQLYVRQVRA